MSLPVKPTPIDTSKRARNELSTLVDDELHSSELESYEPLSPLTPLDELDLPSYLHPAGMYVPVTFHQHHFTCVQLLPSFGTAMQTMDSYCLERLVMI